MARMRQLSCDCLTLIADEEAAILQAEMPSTEMQKVFDTKHASIVKEGAALIFLFVHSLPFFRTNHHPVSTRCLRLDQSGIPD